MLRVDSDRRLFPRPHYATLVLTRAEADYYDARHGAGSYTFRTADAPPLWPTEGAPYVAKQATSLTLLGPGRFVVASTREVDLTVVQWNEPGGGRYAENLEFHGFTYDGSGGLGAELRVGAETELRELVLPRDYLPLTVAPWSGLEPGPDGEPEPPVAPPQAIRGLLLDRHAG